MAVDCVRAVVADNASLQHTVAVAEGSLVIVWVVLAIEVEPGVETTVWRNCPFCQADALLAKPPVVCGPVVFVEGAADAIF